MPTRCGSAEGMAAEASDADALVEEVEAFRPQLTAHCYRMLACPLEAEDAVQETLLRAWSRADRYDSERGTLRAWTFAIASRVCLDRLRSARRRTRISELVAPARPGDEVRLVTDRSLLVWPIADSQVVAALDPASIAEQRSQVRLAFVTMLQKLPARQRAVLLLRDVLGFTAAEAAVQMGSTPSAVESALKRARSTMSVVVDSAAIMPDRDNDLDLLERYCDAFNRGDVDALIGMLHDDVVMEMPPSVWWLQGQPDVQTALLGSSHCDGDRAIPENLNGSIAFRQVRSSATVAHVVLEVKDELVSRITAYIVGDSLDPVLLAPTSLALAERIRP